MPSAALNLGTAVEGSFQGAGGGMVPSARLLTANGGGAPSRREETANGGGPGSDLAALRPTKRPRGKAQLAGKPRRRAPIWNLQAAVFVSVVLNVGLLLQHHVNSTAPSHHDHDHGHRQEHQACPTHLDGGGVSRSSRGRQEVEAAASAASVPKAAGAPSTGKPPVTPDSVINLDHGDPTMFEEFWRGTGAAAEIVIPGWQTMSYFSDVGNVCWFLEPGLDHEVRRLHRLVGNAAVDDGYHVLVGTGSTQLFMAALYALSPPAAAPMSVVSAAPYYSSYPAVTDFLQSGLFRWAGDASSFTGDAYIELVCSPNNPDGAIREAVLPSGGSGVAVHDLAYYWPQYTAITRRADHDIMLFTVSKSTGHAGTRIGWALVKDRDVAKRMAKFIELNTIGVSKDSQLRAAKVLGAVSDAYELPEAAQHRLFDYGRRKMVERWRVLREAAAASGAFSLPHETSAFCNFTKETAATNPAFAWLRCDREDVEDCASFLRGHGILTRSGSQFGADPRYVRVSMLDRDDAYDIFVKRLSSLH
ncbi:tryptophan aminotransferase-related protein 2 [Zea mays]|uniref:Tryptophan aminotransferase n=2 Tax=Zea mays TaxID=4577 RepID=F2FB37_MAIZE|nr:tryptophan aminotransferase-related protein 2 [Zea mays]AQK90450.1 vanishing tassel2 [Zea mays]DAA34789.1 TPA_exp: tryptophan aminotransferase [Zea mays]|eukprot:XP_008655669.1 L-tryptophan--pyruvate aminotransferase 1 [Zea mays]